MELYKALFQETAETRQNERELYTYSESGHACINDEFLVLRVYQPMIICCVCVLVC